MIARPRISLTALAVSLLGAVFAFTASAQTNRATFPADFDKYVLYATYDRASSKEEAFAKPATLEIAKSGAPLPTGTQIVLGIWQDYKLTGYFVMEKGAGWGLEVTEQMRTGDWHFQQFDTQGRIERTAIAERCQSCHQGAAINDFMFTIDRMRAYLP